MFNVKLNVCSVVAIFISIAGTHAFAAQSEILLEERTIKGVVVDDVVGGKNSDILYSTN